MVKFRITVTESERGWGRDTWVETYNTYAEAAARIKEINSRNTAPTAPDWYMVADDRIEAVEG